jgi:glycosyltransferase involved in cell wall biosynthesis
VKRPLRILVAHNVSRERTGGMSRLMSFIHDHLVHAGHSVDFLCAEDVPRRWRGRAARFVFPMMVVQRARAAAKAYQPYDVVNVHEPCGAAIALFKQIAGGPRIVAMSYGVEARGWMRSLEESHLDREKVPLKSRLLWPATLLWQARLALTHADHVFCSNMEDYDYLTTHYRIPTSKITRIHSGADSLYARASCNRDYSRAETLLFAGTWLKRKGVQYLIPAFTELATRHPTLKLVVLNGGAPELAVRNSFPEHVRSRVSCICAQPEAGIAGAIADTDIYVLPSLFEGTPLTLIEAMFAGMPIVTTSTCGMKDVITDGVSGLLVPIRSQAAMVDAVEALLRSPLVRASLGQAARREAVDKYSWQRVAEPVFQIYEALCN